MWTTLPDTGESVALKPNSDLPRVALEEDGLSPVKEAEDAEPQHDADGVQDTPAAQDEEQWKEEEAKGDDSSRTRHQHYKDSSQHRRRRSRCGSC